MVAEALCVDALATVEEALGQQNLYAEILGDLGDIYRKQERWEEAEDAYERALQLTIRLLGDGSVEVRAAGWESG